MSENRVETTREHRCFKPRDKRREANRRFAINGEVPMKLLTTTAALAMLSASSAFAQYQDPYQSFMQQPYGPYSGYAASAYSAYGYVAPGEAFARGPDAGFYYGRSANPAFDVY